MSTLTSLRKQWNRRGFTCNAQKDPAGKSWPVHQHDVDEIVRLEEGDIIVQVGKAQRHPRQYQDLVIPAKTPHAIRNPKSTACHYFYGFRNKR